MRHHTHTHTHTHVHTHTHTSTHLHTQKGVELSLPPIFWTRLRNYFGTAFYVKDNGEVSLALSRALSHFLRLCEHVLALALARTFS